MNESTRQFNISYRRSSRAKKLRITIHPTQAVTVTIPRGLTLEQAQEFVRSKQAWMQKHLRRIQEQQAVQPPPPELSPDQLNAAQDELFARLERFSQKYNLRYRRAAFRCQKTKWGSCSAQNHISLNINMVFLPPHLQDYLLLHELCHIRHKNHSKHFWSQLDEYCGSKAKALAKELKKHRMIL